MRRTKGQTSLFEALGLEDPTGLIKAAPPQTQLKHAAYRAYIGPWLKVMKGQPGGQDIFVLDLYAGPGVYLVDGRRSPGSPVIAAEAAVRLLASWPNTRVHLRCVEPSRDVRVLLKQELDRFQPQLDIAVSNGRAEEHAGSLAAEARGHPTLVLLDPHGINVPMWLVSQFGRRDRTEVLVSFDAHAHYRVAGTTDAAAVTVFWGDESWEVYRRPDYSLDLRAMLEGYRMRLQQTAGFRFATLRRVHFPRSHIDRAIAQGAGSTLAPKIWLEAFDRAASKFDARLLEVAEKVDRRSRIDAALLKMMEFAGRAGVMWGDLYAEVAGVCPQEDDLHQAVLYLREHGCLSWTGRLGRYERPAPRFTFPPSIEALRWDGRERSQPALSVVAMNS